MPDERLSLSTFFNPNNDGHPEAILPKWPVFRGDENLKGSAGFNQEVQSRQVVTVMNFSDYDHDGRATEFLLQIGAQPCGHQQTVVVGISRSNPRLHVFGTIKNPRVPLVLDSPMTWNALLRSRGDTTVVVSAFGDHGSDNEIRIELHATAKGIRAFRLDFDGNENWRPKLRSRSEQ